VLGAVRVVLITDRHAMGDVGAAVARAVAALPAGAALVQVREKDLDGGPLLALVRAAMAAAAGAPVMVNDRLDVALAAGAAGVHLPEHGLAIAEARALAPPGFLIGCSRHTVQAAVAAASAGADLVQLGPIFDTPGKGPPLGVAALRDARAALPAHVRLVAVGGISDAARAAACRAAGADAVAAIRAAWQASAVALA